MFVIHLSNIIILFNDVFTLISQKNYRKTNGSQQLSGIKTNKQKQTLYRVIIVSGYTVMAILYPIAIVMLYSELQRCCGHAYKLKHIISYYMELHLKYIHLFFFQMQSITSMI